jgi:hypothetical protein
MVGYGIDNAQATLPEGAEETAEELRTLRGEVTRVITELRLSLFELRSEVDRNGGLAAAIAEYARTLGTSAGLRVHFTFDESTARLPAATEAERRRRSPTPASTPGRPISGSPAPSTRRMRKSKCPMMARASLTSGRTDVTVLPSWPSVPNASEVVSRSRPDTRAGQPSP